MICNPAYKRGERERRPAAFSRKVSRVEKEKGANSVLRRRSERKEIEGKMREKKIERVGGSGMRRRRSKRHQDEVVERGWKEGEPCRGGGPWTWDDSYPRGHMHCEVVTL